MIDPDGSSPSWVKTPGLIVSGSAPCPDGKRSSARTGARPEENDEGTDYAALAVKVAKPSLAWSAKPDGLLSM